MRSDLKPLEIHQPEGASFTVEGNLVRWQKWSFRVGFTAREGLVLHRVGYDDGGRTRSVLARASFCEMAVPYGDPTMGRHIHSPFDIGENLVGTLANSLELGCDCLGLIRYFDAVVCNSRGEAVRIANAVCLHEEDVGLLWKHYDFRTGQTEVRRSRRLVVSFIASIGNYDYGFYWHLYQDGTIEAEVKATGIVNTAAVEPGTTPRYGGLVAPGLNGMIHQHFFCARLDFDLDGRANTVHEVETRLADPGPDNPFGNAFLPTQRTLRTESEAPALIDPLSARSWLVTNDEHRNGVGEPVGYRLVPGENVRAFAQPGSALERRAGFAFKHVWVTRYDAAERYAAGEYPNQNPGPDGLPRLDRATTSPIENEDVVLWYSFGLHHVPRPEDWPVMPVCTTSASSSSRSASSTRTPPSTWRPRGRCALPLSAHSACRRGSMTQRRTGLAWHELMMWHDTGHAAQWVAPGLTVEPDEHVESPAAKRRIRNLLDVSGVLAQLTPIEPAARDRRGAPALPHAGVRRAHPRSERRRRRRRRRVRAVRPR